MVIYNLIYENEKGQEYRFYRTYKPRRFYCEDGRVISHTKMMNQWLFKGFVKDERGICVYNKGAKKEAYGTAN
jgi:hypothetical protein